MESQSEEDGYRAMPLNTDVSVIFDLSDGARQHSMLQVLGTQNKPTASVLMPSIYQFMRATQLALLTQ